MCKNAFIRNVYECVTLLSKSHSQALLSCACCIGMLKQRLHQFSEASTYHSPAVILPSGISPCIIHEIIVYCMLPSADTPIQCLNFPRTLQYNNNIGPWWMSMYLVFFLNISIVINIIIIRQYPQQGQALGCVNRSVIIRKRPGAV